MGTKHITTHNHPDQNALEFTKHMVVHNHCDGNALGTALEDD